jgi:hypothetical protein
MTTGCKHRRAQIDFNMAEQEVRAVCRNREFLEFQATTLR